MRCRVRRVCTRRTAVSLMLRGRRRRRLRCRSFDRSWCGGCCTVSVSAVFVGGAACLLTLTLQSLLAATQPLTLVITRVHNCDTRLCRPPRCVTCLVHCVDVRVLQAERDASIAATAAAARMSAVRYLCHQRHLRRLRCLCVYALLLCSFTGVART
jgi:hypothetical protein